MFPSNKNVITDAPSTLVPYSTPEAKLLQKRCSMQAKPYTLARLAAGRTTVLPCCVRHSCHATNIGAAMAIDEYVPIRIPTTSAKENPRRTWPPKMYSDSTVRKVSPEVRTVRLRVSLMLRVTPSG